MTIVALGIDPGQSGGLALVHEHGLLSATPIPLVKHTKKPTVDLLAVVEWIDAELSTTPIHVCVIENVHAMPKQGVSSSFQFGRMFGAAEMVCQNYGWENPMYVNPQDWKKVYGLGKDKNSSIIKATEVFGTNKYWKLKKHDGLAEAALIAWYGLREYLKHE